MSCTFCLIEYLLQYRYFSVTAVNNSETASVISENNGSVMTLSMERISSSVYTML